MPFLSSLFLRNRSSSQDDTSQSDLRLVPNAVDEVARLRPETAFASVPKTKNPADGFTTVTYLQYAHAINRTAAWLESKLGKKPSSNVIGYIGPSDLLYVVLTVAAVKADCTMLFLSPRNSLEGQLHLLEHTECSTFISLSATPPGVKSILDSRKLLHLIIPELEELLNGPPVPPRPFTKTFEEVRHESMVVLHSSGTTSLPKPIGYSYGCLAAAWPQLQHGMEGQDRTMMQCAASSPNFFNGFPMFHAGGLFFPLALAVFGGVEMLLPPGGQPLSADMVDQIFQARDVQAVCLPPAILEDLSKKPEYLQRMRNLQYIITGGAPLPKALGDTIQAVGPRIYNMLASTETGVIPTLNNNPEDWQYFRMATDFGIQLRPHDDELFELVIIKDEKLKGRQGVFENYPKLQEYSTQDLFRRHPDPQKQDLWQYCGRFDDVIVLMNGEKFNPIAAEREIQSHPSVLSALVFGRDRVQAALLIEPSKHYSESSQALKEDLIELLWPTILQANRLMPAHGRLSRPLIMLTKPEKPMHRTPKGSVMRNPTYKDYAEDMDTLYLAQETFSRSSGCKTPDTDMDLLEVASLRRLVGKVANLDLRNLSDEDNLFSAGIDSLTVLQLVQNINSSMGKRIVEPALVYNNPSLSQLAAALQGSGNQDSKEPRDRALRVSGMLDNLSLNLPNVKPVTKVAILTGTTGGLGAYLLKSLVTGAKFSKVYCLVRTLPASKPSQDRHVVYLKCNFSDPLLGLGYDIYSELLKSVTHILHNAWQVDFNLSLESFDIHLRGVRHLIDFSARSTHSAHIFFVSSVAAVLKAPQSPVKEDIYDDYHMAQPGGYGEAKHISERLLHIAGLTSGITSSICRVGQIAGPVHQDGIWNKRDWFASLVRSSKHISCIPDSLGSASRIDWIPSDLLSQIVTELFDSDVGKIKTEVYHVVNPAPAEWADLLPAIKQYFGEKMETVALTTWVERLRASASGLDNVNENPAIKLLDFFESIADSTAKALPVLDTTNARKDSPALANLGPVTPEWMSLWLEQWNF